ncbi:MAG: helix-turn-helix domain-containing protein [Streptosporangiaceae bacterium]
MADETIGDRLCGLRRQRGLTQEEAAELAGVSIDLVRKLEQNKRLSARISTLAAIADGLDTELSSLLGRRPRIGRTDGEAAGVLAVRNALVSLADFPGIDPADDGEPTPLSALRVRARHMWKDYWGGHFTRLTETLPPLIAESRLTEHSVGPDVAPILTQAYQVAACLMVHLGKPDLAMLAVERAVSRHGVCRCGRVITTV